MAKTMGMLLRETRMDRGLKLAELSKASGVPVSTISDLEHGRSKQPKSATLIALAAALEMDASDLGVGRRGVLADIVPLNTGRDKLVPLISHVIGGDPEFPEDPYMPGEAEDWLYCHEPHGGETFALRVRGDSMLSTSGPSFPPGCVIFCDPELSGDATVGDLVIARLQENGYTTFKQLAREAGQFYLKPLNPSEPSIREEFEVLAVVIEKRESVRRH